MKDIHVSRLSLLGCITDTRLICKLNPTPTPNLPIFKHSLKRIYNEISPYAHTACKRSFDIPVV